MRVYVLLNAGYAVTSNAESLILLNLVSRVNEMCRIQVNEDSGADVPPKYGTSYSWPSSHRDLKCPLVPNQSKFA